MQLQPVGDRLIVKRLASATAFDGVRVSGAAGAQRRGEVVRVGDGHLDEQTGHRVPLALDVGDEVLYVPGDEAIELRMDDDDYDVIRESDVRLRKPSQTAASPVPADQAGSMKVRKALDEVERHEASLRALAASGRFS